MRIFDDQLIVITGGCGFIGSCLIRHLNDLGIFNIVVVDELGKDERWKNLTGKRFYEIVDKREIFTWLQGREKEIEAFIHLGAISDTQETDASLLLENNYRFSIKLAEYALTNGHRFLYASSAATYGDGSEGFSDDEALLHSLKPLNMYGFSKHLFDLWLLENKLLDQVTGLKFFNIYGPNEWHKGFMSSVVFQWTPKVLKEGEIRLFESSDPERFAAGQQQRDFLYVKDTVKWIRSLMISDAKGIINVGTGIPTTWNELARAIFKALKLKANIKYVPMPESLIGKYQNYTCADTKKLKEALKGDMQITPLEEAVDDYINNYILQKKIW